MGERRGGVMADGWGDDDVDIEELFGFNKFEDVEEAADAAALLPTAFIGIAEETVVVAVLWAMPFVNELLLLLLLCIGCWCW